MDDRKANIDLLFRNGLKDYEVLPPQDVWENIQPVVRKKTGMIVLRYAAAVAVIVSLSFLTWTLSRDFNQGIPDTFAILNISPSQPIKLAESYPSDLPQNSPDLPQNDLMNAPEKAVFNSEIFILSGNTNPGIVLSGPEKADVSSVPQNISIEKFSKELPEYYPEVRLPDKRWSISAMASPTYYSRIGTGNEELMKMAASENATPSYSGGVALAYKISKRFSIQTGLYYSGYGQEIGGVNSFSGFKSYSDAKGSGSFEVMTSNGPVRTSNGDAFLKSDAQTGKVLTAYTNDVFDPEKANLSFVDNSLVQNFSYIQMPVLIRYKFIDRNIDFNLLGGVSYDFLVGNSAFAKTGSGKYHIGDTQGMNFLIFSSSVGMGVEYNFSEKVSLNFEPTLRYFVNPFNDAAGTRIHPYSFGVFSGISYKF